MSDIFSHAALSNLAEFSVSELSGSIKRTVETAFEQVRVRGEISGYRGPHSSGHAYFSLKDDRARIDAVIWKGTFSRLKFRPEEGMEVIATGKITTFPGSSKYQIVIENLEPAGAGALMALLEDRRRRLAAEGLFDPARKRRLPFMPRVIGVVTSPTGAVIRDILHRISDRFPVHVVVWPVKVQGEGSGEEVANAIRGFNALQPGGEIARPDVMIVARGGGSLEDLWSFNDEIVVRAAAESEIPLISAVGHETDTTLIDYAADVRAPTPTGAAEMAVPVRAELEAQLSGLAARLSGSVLRQMDNRRQGVRALVRALPSLDQLLALPRRRFDEAASGLGRGLEITALNKRRAFERSASGLRPETLLNGLKHHRQGISERIHRAETLVERRLLQGQGRVDAFDSALRSLPARLLGQLERQKERVVTASRRADTAVLHRMAQNRSGLAAHDRILQSLSYKNVLNRGYAVIRDDENRPLTRAAAIASGAVVSMEFADGRVSAITTGEGTPSPDTPVALKKKPVKPASSDPGNQGSLF
ncbi:MULTISPECIES: exodeoxyribonuclease VII large subunit [Agrobacterium]|uniref:exodeoxyribonuclease VII large subunit n=1 Tax=Agrobacterium TaxID=357 RepID=UPI0005F018C3|nr:MULTISPECIES: exodeoxyribonuclease VII large subunit [Agrobacterium]MDP9732000.1 exodeoxyribonuclease VII large subunit [Rhizobium sp. SORGH_AS_0285]MDP9756163.1 exodeoxyribonuclease VII large subunit [Rhizobium sp. SORGH_AS_0260]MDR6081176.1 exodeoxyribonuclease VII large subunit [Agrobacterium sp. SORGH_AS_0440]PTV73554.1 exodeoxyribonuclease VII large subunit [Agrobacterium pusense]